MSKFAKFTMVDPMADNEVYQAVAENVNNKMDEACKTLGAKHDRGEDTSDYTENASGSAYKAQQEQEKKERKLEKEKQIKQEEEAIAYKREKELSKKFQNQTLDDLNNESDDDGEDDELARLRMKRKSELQSQLNEKQENMAKGHGQYREVLESEFLKEVTGSKRAIAHFYHRDFEKCKIIDMHLSKLAPKHVECKFVKIDAEKTPFFVNKLVVFTLPTILCFVDGITQERITGFEGLTEGLKPGQEDEFKTEVLQRKLADAGVINYTAPPTKDELIRYGFSQERIATCTEGSFNPFDMDDDDFDFDDV